MGTHQPAYCVCVTVCVCLCVCDCVCCCCVLCMCVQGLLGGWLVDWDSLVLKKIFTLGTHSSTVMIRVAELVTTTSSPITKSQYILYTGSLCNQFTDHRSP